MQNFFFFFFMPVGGKIEHQNLFEASIFGSYNCLKELKLRGDHIKMLLLQFRSRGSFRSYEAKE
jgi:hypothetical protein